MTDVFATALFIAIPATITAIGTAIVSVKQSNKASAKTDARVDARTDEVKEVVAGNTAKLDAVHETVNGNLSAANNRLFAALKENQDLRDQLRDLREKPARRGSKRSTDT